MKIILISPENLASQRHATIHLSNLEDGVQEGIARK
jgi:hypothetical protein